MTPQLASATVVANNHQAADKPAKTQTPAAEPPTTNWEAIYWLAPRGGWLGV